MIYGIFHPGSGCGNMLHRYVATRVLALEKGYEFSMIGVDYFKGKDFMKLDMGKSNDVSFVVEYPAKKIVASGLPLWEEWNKQIYDPDFNFVEDNTIIDGNFEDEKYFNEYLTEIDKWLELIVPMGYRIEDENLCIIGFRGGEFYSVPELGLPQEYFDRAIQEMLKVNGKMKFEVHTDDPHLANKFFPQYEIIADMARNWTAVRTAKYCIIPNSSFHVLPRLLRKGYTIAPRYFNRYNVKRWDFPQSYYKSFKYI